VPARQPAPDILAIAGSLSPSSVNAAALRAAAAVAGRDGIVVAVDETIGTLPHFTPDLELEPSRAVQRFRAACAAAPAVLLSVPEYAFGIPGACKNALDWTVGAGSLSGKPVTLLSVAPAGRGMHVRGALDLVLRALDARVEHRAVPIGPRDRDPDGEIRDPRLVAELRAVVAELAGRSRRAPAA
jgi:NAD(P)H-dependent FMN reductase